MRPQSLLCDPCEEKVPRLFKDVLDILDGYRKENLDSHGGDIYDRFLEYLLVNPENQFDTRLGVLTSEEKSPGPDPCFLHSQGKK